MTIAIPIAIAPEKRAMRPVAEGIVAALGDTFRDTPVPDVAVHCSPQLYPLGQQFPPRFAAQLYQSLGQDPPCGAAVVATLAPLGAAIVTPFVLIIVASEVGMQVPVV